MKILICFIGTLLCALNISAFPTPKKNVPPQCVDPTFACQDLKNARACDVVKSCIHDIWSTMSVPDDNDEICDICKKMVKEARDQLLSNMTQEEIKEVFEGSCKLIPIKLVADSCSKLVDEFIPQLVEMLASRMDPNMVCTVSGLCYATHIPENKILKFFKLILNTQKDSQCAECTKMAIDVQTFFKSTPKDDLKKYIENFCDEKVPSYMCDALVNNYFPSIYNYIISNDAKSLCTTFGICPKVCGAKDNVQINDELTCEFCEHVLQHIKDLITTNTTVEEFRTALLNFCKHVGSFSDRCTSLVNDYYDMLFDYIRKLDTKAVCTVIGLCNDQKCSVIPLVKLIPALEAKTRIPMVKLQPASHIQSNLNISPLVKLIPASVMNKNKMIETNDIFPVQLPLERLNHPLSIFERDTDCAFCKAISFYIKQDLNGDLRKESVRNAINNVCEKWVKDFPDHCKVFLRKYSLKFEHSLAKGLELEKVCTFSGICVTDDNKSELNVRVLPPHKELKDSPFCDMCKDAFSEIEKTLSDPSTKGKIKNILDQSCNILPNSLKDDCVSFVNSNVDALIDILQQELQPDNICPALHLCDISKRLKVSQRVKDLECDLCKDVVTTFREKLSNPDAKKMVLIFLEEGCARLPGSLSQECKTFVDENIDTVMGMIIEEMDPDNVCSILRICPASLQKKKPEKLNDEVECELCKEIIKNVEDIIKEQKTEAEIKAALDKVCSYLPSSISTKCQNLVDTYSQMIIVLLIQELDPSMICTELKLCPSSLQKEKPGNLKDIECDLCKEIIEKVYDIIKEQRTEAEIEAALDKVCSYLPSSVSAKCQDFVNTYTDTIIVLLMQELDPSLVCAELKLCPSSLYKEKSKKVKKVKDLECDLCKEVIGKVEDIVKEQKTEAKIQAALDKVCSYLPSSISTKCQNFVDTYTNTIIILLMQELDPSMVCAELKLCPSTVGFPEWKLKAEDLECQGCQYAFHFLQEQLYNNDTQAEIKNLMKRVCGLLPEIYANNCDAFVDEYGDSLLVLIAQEIDPNKMCYELQICTNQTRIFVNEIGILHPFKTDECSVCTTVVDYIDKLLEEDDVDKEITSLIEKICTILPVSYIDKCSSMLETYGPYILQMIGQVANSKEVCQEIDMCSRPPGHVHLVGGNKCTFGPSYWCKSSAHASACKAEMFCKNKVWKN